VRLVAQARRVVRWISAPETTRTDPPFSSPTRMRGPCRSRRIPTFFRARAAAERTRRQARVWSALVPWEKLRRATSSPARIMRASTGVDTEAGPSVATILVRRTLDGERGENLVGVALDLHATKHVFDLSLPIDDERRPFHAQKFRP